MRARSIFFSSLLFCVCLQQSQSAINWSLIAFIPKVTYEVVELLLKANKIIGPYSTSIPHPLFDKAEHYLFARLEVITDKLDYLSTSHEGRESTVGQLVRNLPQRLRLELHLNDLLDYTTRVNVNYRRMHLYVHEKDEIEKDTLVDFAENVISHDSSSVVNLLERMYAFVVPHEKGIGDTGLLPALAKSLTVRKSLN